MEPSDVDVVVVAYNSRDELRGCVAGPASAPGVHVAVIDNASPDRSFEAVDDVEGVTVIRMPRNGGFAYGCNAGWRAGTSPHVLFLNPDARIGVEDIRRLSSVLDADPRIGAVGPRIHHDDGSLDFSVRRFPRLRSTYAQALFLHRVFPHATWVDEPVRTPESYDRAGTVEWISGACVLVRRTVLERIGGLDEGFFLYCEDIDLCRRIADAGLQVRYEPGARCVHIGGASAPRGSLLPVLAASRVRYARIHRHPLAALAERVGIALGEVTHAFVGRGGRDARTGHLRAAQAAIRGRAPSRP